MIRNRTARLILFQAGAECFIKFIMFVILNVRMFSIVIFSTVVCLKAVIAQTPEFWNNLAKETLEKRLEAKMNTNKAKNVILFLGDGMGMPSIIAGRILKGQQHGMLGEEASLAFDTFPHIGISKTYNTDATVADSAGTATAFLCGVKSKYGTIGVDDNIIRYNCSTVKGSKLSCIADWAIMSGKGVGFVTNMRVTHATPAPLYAASAERYWEHGGETDQQCDDIAKQLIMKYPGSNLQVIMGGGRTNFFSRTMRDYEYRHINGNRVDGINLIEKWKEMRREENESHAFVWNKDLLDQVDVDDTNYILGLFEPNHMKAEGDPTLAEMTDKAIRVLQNSEPKNGFFLLVEGGLIDHFHHKNLAVRAISDVIEFDKAIQVALNLTDFEDTLIIVTADHSHSMHLNGYPNRGDPIFGANSISNVDNMPYTSLLYTTGPGYDNSGPNGTRPNLTNIDTSSEDYVSQTAVPRSSAAHGGEDVVSYAQGPMAHLLTGVYEQNFIAHVMAYASRIGPYSALKQSSGVQQVKASAPSSASCQQFLSTLHVFILFIIFLAM